jgi:hypothetical protein
VRESGRGRKRRLRLGLHEAPRAAGG